LLSNYKIELFGKDEIIIKDGEKRGYFYYIIDGQVNIIKNNTVLNTLHQDDYFGEISALTGNKATADVVSREESQILRIPSNKFKEIIDMNEELAQKIAEVIAIRKLGLTKISKQINDKIEKKINKESKTIFNRIKKYFSI
jgi:type IV pilus assembly protein PilB